MRYTPGFGSQNKVGRGFSPVSDGVICAKLLPVKQISIPIVNMAFFIPRPCSCSTGSLLVLFGLEYKVP